MFQSISDHLLGYFLSGQATVILSYITDTIVSMSFRGNSAWYGSLSLLVMPST